MSFLRLKKVILLTITILPLVITLIGCSPQNATSPSGLIWTITVSKVEVKANLNSVEKVTQYNGSESDIPHQQTPDVGNVYLILNLEVQKAGPGASPFSWQSLSVQDDQGNLYHRHANDSFLEQYSYSPRITGLDVRLGEQRGWLCFEIPAKASKGKLTLSYKGEGSQQVISLQP